MEFCKPPASLEASQQLLEDKGDSLHMAAALCCPPLSCVGPWGPCHKAQGDGMGPGCVGTASAPSVSIQKPRGDGRAAPKLLLHWDGDSERQIPSPGHPWDTPRAQGVAAHCWEVPWGLELQRPSPAGSGDPKGTGSPRAALASRVEPCQGRGHALGTAWGPVPAPAAPWARPALSCPVGGPSVAVPGAPGLSPPQPAPFALRGAAPGAVCPVPGGAGMKELRGLSKPLQRCFCTFKASGAP